MRCVELAARIKETEANYDARIKLVRTPLTATYHTALKPDAHPTVYALYPSTCYAYDLLQYGGEDHIQKAAAILEVVMSCQDQDSTRATYGIWPYFYEETLDEMDRPDWNMADFHGKKLLLILKNNAQLLPQPLLSKLRDAVYHACKAIMIRDVGPHYTNIAIMGAAVTLIGGEVLGNEEFRSYGEQRLRRFHVYTTGIGTFTEYNSPCYTPIAIEELHVIYSQSSSADAVEIAGQLLDIAWHMIGRHYHAATGAWGGPHSRTYRTALRPIEREFLTNGLAVEASGPRCPEKYRCLFDSTDERYYTEPTVLAAETGYQNYATTYQNEALTLGSFSRGSMWNQRRNLIGYVDAGDGRTVSVQLQFLKDGKDFCSAIFTGVQSRKQVLFSLNLATDNGAWHQDLDIINGRFRAKDLRIRLLIGGDAALLDIPVIQDGARLEAQLGATALLVKAVLDNSGYGPLSVQAERTADGVNLDYVIASGEEREFDFHALDKAVWIFILSLGEDQALPAVTLKPDGMWVTASVHKEDDSMAITVSVVPRRTKELYRDNQIQMPRALKAQ
ncbi:hypothetical protein SAMN02799630_03332 [Paenibacillus sp. UNCCL117]|uniref:hypothetical protein n=1 Tax=unclassified Paenibacillus TaxID=185978 RepID=UPI00088EE1D6|nr:MULTISPECIES: hypothetical protein [unclassified Paenibacillus]SDE42920.1 hypothetical protein SAMN04488602_1284 [Paenibacillus sp. cl123]SFW45865.1 hypothetical protein SAMN02799630_03332 [Paenibacillus sp. UNCCL117]